MKTAISVPDPIFERVDAAARRLGISRSEFYATAARRWADELERHDITEQIDAVLIDVDQEADENVAFLRAAARRTLTEADRE